MVRHCLLQVEICCIVSFNEVAVVVVVVVVVVVAIVVVVVGFQILKESL